MCDGGNPLFFKGFFDLGWCGERNYGESWGIFRDLWREFEIMLGNRG